jgi:hypothetical protein
MIDKKTWKEFKECGLLWWINMILHTFGWAIVFNVEDSGEISEVFPARVKYRGFGEKYNSIGYMQVSEYLKKNAEQLETEARE